ncbi:Neuromedin-U receptor 1 [Acipenser ruthenus]|uniref:Neuromedin-U receptor 1 n=1 Tax=Acipenser ruthenus TaxID=7906 RepID=A0A444U246_ACIRT|nr:Neuromedin-U receptor 1 [Acipenser ruthenus]
MANLSLNCSSQEYPQPPEDSPNLCNGSSLNHTLNQTWNLEDFFLSNEELLIKYLGPRRSSVFLPVCITYLTIFVVGVCGNALICMVIAQHKVMRTPTNYYLFSLAISDLLVLFLGMPLELYEMWSNYPFLFGKEGCYFKTFLFETVCFASILNVTALSVERYIAVVHPLKAKQRQGGEGFFFLPMVTISVLYLLIGLQLKREKMLQVLEAKSGLGRDSYQSGRAQQQKMRRRQVTKMLFVLVVVFGICWAPFHTDRLTWSFIEHWTGDKHLVFQYVHILSGVFFYLSSAVNPILYNLMSTRFREMFNDVMCQGSHRPNGRKYSLSVTRVTTRSVVGEPPPGHGPALSDVEDYELYLECNNENETSFT